MTNQQKLKKLFARLDEIDAYGRSIGKLSFDMECCAPEEGTARPRRASPGPARIWPCWASRSTS